jgi:hypothetical protein
MLSRAILFLDSRCEFQLYFVEITRRHDFGNKHSTRLLRALGLCCRFRFMFFEKESEFSPEALMLAKDDIKEWARKLIRELSLQLLRGHTKFLEFFAARIRNLNTHEPVLNFWRGPNSTLTTFG